ncbi:hypothetical protein VDF37_20630, partial [Xanthomonas campestris pv. raphani]|nr:hypothetical protein [Xanthomonas campestris pv. raphani]MEA9918999.1 hypothetical protein [Xanthomonas campestris pv. raphani]
NIWQTPISSTPDSKPGRYSGRGDVEPGTALELPRMWEPLLEKHSSRARIYSQSEFLKEFGNDSK